MDILTADQLLEHAQSQPIVNERPPRLLTADQLLAPESAQGQIDREVAAERRQIALPKTWFGEFWNAGKTGVDQLQQLGYQAGAMASDAVGFDSLKDWFIKGSEQQDKEIAGEPINVEDSSQIQGFDSFMRWFAGAAGKAVPQLAEAAATTAIGALVGSAIGPEGTVGGAVEGFVGREAVKNALKIGVKNLVTEGVDAKLVSAELKAYARGKISKDAMSEPAKDIMVNEFRGIMSKYAADGALLTNSVGQETASIYQDSADLPDSNRKVNALIGGLAAGVMDFIPDAYIANKFFPGAGRVTHGQVAESKDYLIRLSKAAATELPKVFAIESGTEYFQTLTEFAAHNYADPAKRDAIFDYTPDQMHQALEAAKQGGVGGLIGGGVASLQEARNGKLPPHPNPMVRKAEGDIEQKARDADPIAADMAGPEDKQLSAILTQQRDLQAVVADPATEEKVKAEAIQKIDDLEKEANKILGTETPAPAVVTPFVNETPAPVKTAQEAVVGKTIEQLTAEQAARPTIIDRGIEHLKAFYEKVLPRPEPIAIDQEAVTRQREKVTSVIAETVKGQEDTPEAQQYSEAIHAGLTDQTLHFLDAEGIDIRLANKTDMNKGMRPSDSGVLSFGRKGIALILPTLEGIKEQSNKLAVAEKPGAQDRAPFIAHLHDLMGHELVHVADYVNIRNKWQAKPEGLNYSQFLQRETENRGKALRDAFPGIQKIISKTYSLGDINELSDSQLGDESMRMAVEFVRQGKIEEITQALARAAQEKEQKPGKISKWLKSWIESIMGMRDVLTKMLGKDSPVAFLQDLHDINQMLDKYGVLVNAKQPEVQPNEKAKVEEAPAPAPSQEAAPVVEQHPNPPLGTEPVNKGTQVEAPKVETPKPTKQERAKERLDKAIAAAKKGKPLTDAIRAHIRYQRSQGLEPDAKAFKAIYGKGATSIVYHEVAKSFVNEKAAAKSATVPDQPEDIAKALNLEYKGVMMDMLDLYNDMLPDSPAFGTTIAVKVGSTKEQVSDKVDETRAKFGNVPKEKGPAMAARVTNKQKNNVELISQKVNASYSRHFGTIVPKPAESRKSGIAAFWQGISPSALRYDSETKTQATFDAQQAINQVGDGLKMARILENDVRGETLGIANDDPDNIAPSATIGVVYQIVARQLADLDASFVNEDVGLAAKSEVRKLLEMLRRRLSASMTGSGQFGAMAGAPESIFNGLSARRGFVESIMESIDRVIGKGKREDLHKLAADLNEQGVKYTPVASFSPKVIKAVRAIYTKLNDVKFQKGSRETILGNIKRMVRIVNKAAARAANIIANDEDSEARGQKLAESVIGEMTGLPRTPTSKPEDALFYAVASRFARTTAVDMGLIVKPAKTEKATVAQAMATILKNPQAYQRFAEQLYTAYIAEYGGTSPDARFMQQAEEFYNRVLNKMGGQDLITPLVNEKMRELEMKFSKIAQLKYSEGNFTLDQLASAIADEMRQQGIEDPAIMNQLAHDIDVEVQAQLEKARDKFFGDSKTIKGFLDTIGFSLREAAASLRVHSDNVEGQLRELLMGDEYGFPDTADLPIASQLAKVMQQEINALVEGENAARIQTFLDDAQKALNNPTPKRQANMRKAVERLLEMTKLGIVRQEDIYKAIAEQFPELPPYSEATANRIEEIGDMIYNAQHPRQINELKQQLADLMRESRPLTTTQAKLSAMYFSMLSSPTTFVEANPIGNLTQLMGYIAQMIGKSVTQPRLIYPIFQALFKTAMGKGFWEARETFYNGMELGKQTSKYLTTRSPFELRDPYFQSGIPRDGKLNNALANLDEKVSTAAFKMSRAMGGKYVIRSLVAADIFFHKIAEEIAYTYKSGGGEALGTPMMFTNALDEARSTMLAVGENPDADRKSRSKLIVLANSIFEGKRLRDSDGVFVNERVIAWQEAHAEGLRVTLNQEPKGMFGAFHRMFNSLGDRYPITRLFVPFTRIAANQMNMALDFTPWGLARWAMGGEFAAQRGGEIVEQDDGTFKIEGGEQVKDIDLVWRSAIGTIGLFSLMALMSSNDDDDDPYFWIYGSGPRDKTKKGLLMERGWKPNTVKVGNNYYNYLLTPLSLVFSMIGYHSDKYLDGQISSPNDIGVSSTMVAMMDSVKNQSFLATLADFASAVDSPDPEGRINKIMARTAGVVVPNAVKWLDRITNPTIQEAKTFGDVMISEIPFARMSLKPRLNYFGEPITRAQGILPGLDRIATAQRSDDPVINFITDHYLDLPGYSKSTRLLNNAMSAEQFYDYVAIAGPEIKKGIRANLAELEVLDHEQQKDLIERIARDAKANARKFIIDRDKIERLPKGGK